MACSVPSQQEICSGNHSRTKGAEQSWSIMHKEPEVVRKDNSLQHKQRYSGRWMVKNINLMLVPLWIIDCTGSWKKGFSSINNLPSNPSEDGILCTTYYQRRCWRNELRWPLSGGRAASPFAKQFLKLALQLETSSLNLPLGQDMVIPEYLGGTLRTQKFLFKAASQAQHNSADRKLRTSPRSGSYADGQVSHHHPDFLVWENKSEWHCKTQQPVTETPDTDEQRNPFQFFGHATAWFEHTGMEAVQSAAVLDNCTLRHNFVVSSYNCLVCVQSTGLLWDLCCD